MRIVSVVGARPNFMKIAPFIRAIEEHNRTIQSGIDHIEHVLVHTGQHYDDKMSKAFFKALGIPDADINLGIGSGSHAEQVGRTMIEFEKVVRDLKPDWVVVVGDVNATAACSITAKKEHVKVAHIEAGLRSRDMEMPEEINRLVTDRLADLLLTPDELSSRNLKDEGIPDRQIKFVGNIMIDTLEANRDKATSLDIKGIIDAGLLLDQESVSLTGNNLHRYALMTMHRPSNVDKPEVLSPIIDFLISEVATEMPLIWPIHPRAAKQLQAFGLWKRVMTCPRLLLLHPLGYHELLRLNLEASIMLTDSGGLQEECCVLGTSCMTMRWNTERPITLKDHGGASVLVGNDIARIREAYRKELNSSRNPKRPNLWDGETANRCLDAILEFQHSCSN